MVKAHQLICSQKPQLKKSRINLTQLYVFTIDGDAAKLLDDGLSIERCKVHVDCWKVRFTF